jgi:hypothetical protein
VIALAKSVFTRSGVEWSGVFGICTTSIIPFRVFEHLAQQDKIEGGRDHERIEAEQIHEWARLRFSLNPRAYVRSFAFRRCGERLPLRFLLSLHRNGDGGWELRLGLRTRGCLRAAWEGDVGLSTCLGKRVRLDGNMYESSGICYENGWKATKGIMNLFLISGT